MNHDKIAIGGDPRDTDEFMALRQEVNKINHPERPPVDWEKIETLSLRLFKKNGIDLQTAIYYTLARTKLEKLRGFTEGTEVLAALMGQAWEKMWPKQPAARHDMLEWLNGRVSPDIRALAISVDDYPLIESCNAALETIKNAFTENQVSPMPRLVYLLDFIRETQEKLDETITQQSKAPEIAIETTTLPPKAQSAPIQPPESILVATPKPPEKHAVIPSEKIDNSLFWKGFLIGMIAGLFVCLMCIVILFIT